MRLGGHSLLTHLRIFSALHNRKIVALQKERLLLYKICRPFKDKLALQNLLFWAGKTASWWSSAARPPAYRKCVRLTKSAGFSTYFENKSKPKCKAKIGWLNKVGRSGEGETAGGSVLVVIRCSPTCAPERFLLHKPERFLLCFFFALLQAFEKQIGFPRLVDLGRWIR